MNSYHFRTLRSGFPSAACRRHSTGDLDRPGQCGQGLLARKPAVEFGVSIGVQERSKWQEGELKANQIDHNNPLEGRKAIKLREYEIANVELLTS